ncbi:sigma-54-dependent Fis family transcriptional regulator [Pandoraea cepalis]|uniref:Sigma-54-dependent Fis family transcriptional regulator n=1 Tax=Pandoraea cepalis TaxID=2508294 RepID=A0AAW7MJ08_9BURK|nr:sigma-54-dependent Fis family transcriptional regulator [Pandoraea cepalis]MDN4572603.1 sigma-54-dependent Fis family transcriptional regulator [Pandoraea cepalis]MDN4577018.1 sigma-54-dependent Fis family transcriptional regulator [Pandoraea cepalis]
MPAKTESAHARRVLDVVQGHLTSVATATDPNIASSWRRCLDTYALDPGARMTPRVLASSQLRERRSAMERLCHVSMPVLERLQRQLMNPRQAVLLTAPDGVIVDSRLHDDTRDDFHRAGLWPGADWSESCEGTNGIGTCVVERAPVIICQQDHFRALHTPLTCTASPVFAPQGDLLAVIDVSSTSADETRQSQFHTLALVNLSAKVVERDYFFQHYRDEWLLQLQEPGDHLGDFAQALLAFDDTGHILAANQSALNRLGATRDVLVGTRVDRWFAQALDTLFAQAHPAPSACWPIRTHTGEALVARVRSPLRAARRGTRAVSVPHEAAVEPFSDPVLAREFSRACRVFAHDVPVLIRGETGSGKEVFARAVHAASARASGPFVALNCAAIPESLIESELFGYVGGSFTGARKEGMAGKLWQANGGTLFLDEIGDMPFAMQTRLLRVLEDRRVSPLGGGEPVPLDIRVLSATHRDLHERIAERQFREDLFYRLSGLEVRVPSLRERDDKVDVMHTLLAQACPQGPIGLTDAARDRLCAYPWPGNVRQMRSVIRTLVALSERGVITLDDLPDALRDAPGLPPIDPPTEAPLEAAERQALRTTLDACQGQVSAAARKLGVSRNTLYRKLKRFGLLRG